MVCPAATCQSPGTPTVPETPVRTADSFQPLSSPASQPDGLELPDALDKKMSLHLRVTHISLLENTKARLSHTGRARPEFGLRQDGQMALTCVSSHEPAR